MGSVGKVLEWLNSDDLFEPELVEFLTSDEPTARRIMTDVIKQRTERKAREFTSCFGLKEGAPIKRACGVCKAEVYLSHRGLYATPQGGAAHDSCNRCFAPSAP